jgi:hypothetical protein
MKKFSEVLPTLENTDHVQHIELFNDDGSSAGVIENKPGSQGSVKLYHHLWKKWGNITIDAAREGLKLYAEHTEDAEINPGKHPNIDHLFSVIEDKKPLSVKIVVN